MRIETRNQLIYLVVSSVEGKNARSIITRILLEETGRSIVNLKGLGGKKRKILEITDFLQGARKKKNTRLEFFVNFLPIGRTFRAYINDERAKTTKDFNTSKIIARPCFAVSSSRFFPPIFSPAFPGYYFLPVYNVFTHAL